jgi:hypothetical protein
MQSDSAKKLHVDHRRSDVSGPKILWLLDLLRGSNTEPLPRPLIRGAVRVRISTGFTSTCIFNLNSLKRDAKSPTQQSNSLCTSILSSHPSPWLQPWLSPSMQTLSFSTTAAAAMGPLGIPLCHVTGVVTNLLGDILILSVRNNLNFELIN